MSAFDDVYGPDLGAYPAPGSFTSRQVAFERARIGTTMTSSLRYSEHIADGAMRDEMVHRLEAEVLREKLVGETYTTAVSREITLAAQAPASWWQHFKLDHLPTIAKWRPVRFADVDITGVVPVTVTTVFERYATYPGACVNLPASLGAPVIYETARMS